MTTHGWGGVEKGLMFTVWIGGLISQNVWMKLSLFLLSQEEVVTCSEMKKPRFSHLSDVVRLLRGTELQSAASRLSLCFTHRLSSGPGS